MAARSRTGRCGRGRGLIAARREEEVRSAEAGAIAARYRRARVYLGGALCLLAGTAVYLIADEGLRIWASTRSNLTNLAIGLETSVSDLLDHSYYSLSGIAADVATQAGASPERTRSALREAMRFDPVSAYLGLKEAARAGTTLVDRSGTPMPADVAEAVHAAIADADRPLDGSARPHLLELIRLPHQQDWYLPLTIGVPRADGTTAVAFALVPARRLVAGTESLQLLPDSWVSLIRSDGQRLISYSQSENALQINGPPIKADELRSINIGGPFEVLRPSTRQTYMASFSRAPHLPLAIGVALPARSLYQVWLQQAAGPALVLLLSVIAIAIFALQLNATLRRQRAYVAQQEFLAKHDSLTGLLNRDAFMRFLERAIASGPEDAFAVLLLDLNHFKDINDTLGHAAGDQVLQQIGARLAQRMCDGDSCVARLGGDELTVFVRGVDRSETLEALFERVQQCLGQTVLVGSVELNLTASIGAALYPIDAATPAELLRCADIAMYSAKGELRPFGRYSTFIDNFTPEMLALKSEFAKALRDGDVSVVYQPKVRLSDGGLVGLEALARWNHPTLGSVPPARFVQLAEGTELIHPFTQHVLKLVVTQIARWRTAGNNVPVAVNISVNNLLDHTLVGKLSDMLASEGVPPHLLELELTESAVMRYPDTVLRRLQRLRDLGVRLAIDDFGTGYASLAYLKQLPVQTLKIDKSFVLNLASDAADQRIVRSSVQLAHGFGMTVVAEGVESRAVAQQLQAYGCDHAQGYHFGRPQTGSEIETRWLEQPEIAVAAGL
jgi:diguanylate cyclase (GGDEF)-like protein